MVKHASMFSQPIAMIGRKRFHELVYHHKPERFTKKFNSWEHFISMLFCQLAQAKCLREICDGIACCIGKMKHPGMKAAPNKSTLSYANSHRSWELFRELFYQFIDKCRAAAPVKHKFRFKNKLLSLDSSTIFLCLSLSIDNMEEIIRNSD